MRINALAVRIHEWAQDKGWWDNPDRNIGELVALAHSELSEALEEWRVGRMQTEIIEGKPEGFPVELADTVIRILDICESQGIDLEAEIEQKMQYNKNRAYRHGGKLA